MAAASPDPHEDDWDTRVAGVLAAVPGRLRPPIAWLARQRVAKLLAQAAAGLVQVQIFDRAMTLAAQVFTSVFPLLIMVGVVFGRDQSGRLSDFAHLPEASRQVIDDALSHRGFSSFGVVGCLVVLLSSTGLARALARAYALVWSVRRTPAGPGAAWRWLVVVLTLAAFAVGTRLLGWLTAKLPLSDVSSAVLLLLADCAVAVLVPWLLLGHTVPARMLIPGAAAFAAVMLAVRPVGSIYLPRALQTSADRYGTIGVAFTYIGWLYVLAFCLLLTAVLGRVLAQDEGRFGRLVRGGGAPPPTLPGGDGDRPVAVRRRRRGVQASSAGAPPDDGR